MGAYREQLLRETCGPAAEETPSRSLTLFKLRFTICLLLFAGFLYLDYTKESIYGVTADSITEAVADDWLRIRLCGLAESWN